MRDDFTYSFSARGRHDLRTGGELLLRDVSCGESCRQCMGHDRRPRRPAAVAERSSRRWFPDRVQRRHLEPGGDLLDHARLHHRCRQLRRRKPEQEDRPLGAGRLADHGSPDAEPRGALRRRGSDLFANDISFPPFQEPGRPNDWNNVQPRLGFAYRLNDRTVMRGGSGIYYGDAFADAGSAIGNTQIATIRYENDGRPDFAANPTNGRAAADLRGGAAPVLRQQQQCARMSPP